MDGSSFDRWTREFAAGGSRRWFGKRLVVFAGTAIAGIATLRDSDAARRPVQPTPPPSCPGIQVWSDSGCSCPSGSTKCGPDCCPEGQAECCDGVCCYGACVGEEWCCPAGNIACDGVCRDWECCDDTDCNGDICDPETHTCLVCTPKCDGTVWGENSCGDLCTCDPGRTPLDNGSCGVPCAAGADCAATGCATCMYSEDGPFCTNGNLNGMRCGGFGGTCPAGFACDGLRCTQLC